jgi:hypothetical protein
MNAQDILSALDAEISRLQSARSLLVGTTMKSRGRPRTSESPAPVSSPKRRMLSAEAREKIAEAQRERWAKQKAAKKK